LIFVRIKLLSNAIIRLNLICLFVIALGLFVIALDLCMIGLDLFGICLDLYCIARDLCGTGGLNAIFLKLLVLLAVLSA
jgi:hypothetical protein